MGNSTLKSTTTPVTILDNPLQQESFFDLRIRTKPASLINSTPSSRTQSTSSSSTRPTSSLLTLESTSRTTSSNASLSSSTSSLDKSKPKRGLSLPKLRSLRKTDNKVHPQSTSSLISTFTTSLVGSIPWSIKSTDEAYDNRNLTNVYSEDEDSENCYLDPDCVSTVPSTYSIQEDEIPMLCITNPNNDVTSYVYIQNPTKTNLEMKLKEVDDES